MTVTVEGVGSFNDNNNDDDDDDRDEDDDDDDDALLPVIGKWDSIEESTYGSAVDTG